MEVEAVNASRHGGATEGEEKTRTHGNKAQPSAVIRTSRSGPGVGVHTQPISPCVPAADHPSIVVVVIITASEMKPELGTCWAMWPDMDLTIIFLKCISNAASWLLHTDLGPNRDVWPRYGLFCDDDVPEIVEVATQSTHQVLL